MEFMKKEFRQYGQICNLLKYNRNSMTPEILAKLEDRKQVIERTIDATCGRKTRAVIITDSGHVVLSALLPETICARVQNYKDTEEE